MDLVRSYLYVPILVCPNFVDLLTIVGSQTSGVTPRMIMRATMQKDQPKRSSPVLMETLLQKLHQAKIFSQFHKQTQPRATSRNIKDPRLLTLKYTAAMIDIQNSLQVLPLLDRLDHNRMEPTALLMRRLCKHKITPAGGFNPKTRLKEETFWIPVIFRPQNSSEVANNQQVSKSILQGILYSGGQVV
jgi:hypothetical protein